jgi:hypothetical protein
MARRYANDTERITRNVLVNANGCWVWTKYRDRNGYGRLYVGNRVVLAHRFAYEAFIGPVPNGLPLDHLCRNRACCNPRHADPVPQVQNLHRSPETVNTINAAKTACPRDHPYDSVNTYVDSTGARHCRACRSDANRRYRDRRALRAAGITAA